MHFARNVVSRGTSRLYWGNECLTLYSSGTCVLTGGDNTRLEGTYQIKDGWIIFHIGNKTASCKATIGRDGSVSLFHTMVTSIIADDKSYLKSCYF